MSGRSPDVVIIGGGIIGCALAHRLAQAGVHVTVVERGEIGGEASGAAAGIVGPQMEYEGRPEFASSRFLAFCQESRTRHAALAAELKSEVGEDVGYRECGLLCLAFTDEDETAVDARARALAAAGAPVARLSGAEVRRAEPGVSPAVRWGILMEGDHEVDNVRLTAALAAAARARGATFLTRTLVTRIFVEGGRVTGVEAGGRTIPAGRVVDAAGAWARLVPGVPQPLVPVEPIRGQIVVLEGESPSHVIFTPRGYLVPRRPPGLPAVAGAQARVLAGSTMESVGFRKEVTADAVSALLAAAREAVPSLGTARFVEAWAGFRPATPDHLPVIGPLGPEGLIAATGHFRSGILLAPITADLVSDYIQTGRLPAALEPFSPARFQAAAVR